MYKMYVYQTNLGPFRKLRKAIIRKALEFNTFHGSFLLGSSGSFSMVRHQNDLINYANDSTKMSKNDSYRFNSVMDRTVITV